MRAVASTWRDHAPGRRFPEISWATVALVFAGLAFLPRAAAVQPLSALDPVEIYADGFGDLRGIVVDPQGNVFVTDRSPTASAPGWRADLRTPSASLSIPRAVC